MKKEIEQIEKLLVKATPRPWQLLNQESDKTITWVLGPIRTDELMAEFHQGTWQAGDKQPREIDAELVVALVNISEKLISKLRQVTELNLRLQQTFLPPNSSSLLIPTSLVEMKARRQMFEELAEMALDEELEATIKGLKE